MSISVHAFSDSARLGRALARLITSSVSQVRVHRFPDEESLVTVAEPAAHAVLVRSLHQPNGKIIETLLAADALRRAGARRLTLVAPYLPYMRQDAVFQRGQPLSQRVVGLLLARSFDRVLTVEAHLHRVPTLAAVVKRGSHSLSAATAIAGWIRRHGGHDCFVAGPDAESAPMIRAVARAAALPWAVATKQRRGDRTVHLQFGDLPPCSAAVLVDDIASTGSTLAAATHGLRQRGVHCIAAVAVHALFAPGALTRLRTAGITTVVTTDSIAHPTNVIRCAPLIAAALEGIEGSRDRGIKGRRGLTRLADGVAPRSLDPSIS